MITSPCNVYPLTPHFYIVKLGFTGVYIISYFCSKTYIVGTLTCTNNYVLSKNMKIVKKIEMKNVTVTAVKNRCILHGRVFVMSDDNCLVVTGNTC